MPLVLLGPTATGKSELALRLGERLGGEIVNADALQVYRGFDIGTAKPGPEARRRVPHHLLDILEPHERFSAGAFARLGREAVEGIRERGHLPLVVGGSGLYLRALLEGMSPIPEISERLRSWTLGVAADRGAAELARMLRVLDPALAERLEPADVQRLQRGVAVALGTGRTLSSWQAEPPRVASLPAARLGLTLPRALLYDRIAGRVFEMLAAGWVGEVESLLAAGLDPGLPAFRAIGYRELARYVLGEWGRDEAVEATIRATRRFAKRQLTWFRKEPGIRWFQARDLQAVERQILADLENRREHGEAHDQHPGRFSLPEPQRGAPDDGGADDG